MQRYSTQKLLIFFLFWVGLFGCRTLKKNESVSAKIDKQSIAELKNKNLWSPSNRLAYASYYYILGEDKLLNGKFAKSKNAFATAYDLNPNSFLAAKILEVELYSGANKKTLNHAKKFALLFPRSARIRTLYGSVLSQLGKLNEAVNEYNKAIELGAEQDLAYLQILRIKLAQKKVKKALEVGKRWVKNIPNSAEARFELAKIYLALKQNKKALAQSSVAVQLQPNRPEMLLLNALTLEVNGKSKIAVDLYEKLYRMNSNNERLIIHMASLYRQIGEPKDALELLDEILRKSKRRKRPDIALQRAVILWEMGEFSEAAQSFIKLHQKYPKSLRLKYLAGLGYEKRQVYKQALEIYTDLEKSTAFFKPARLRRAIVLSRLRRLEEAVELVEELQNRERERGSSQPDPNLEVFLAGFYSDAGKHGQAVTYMEKVVKSHPESLLYRFFLGVYQEKSGDIKASIETMRRVIAMNPKYSQAYNYIAYIYAEKNQNLLEAKALVERAIALKSGDGLYLDTLGWIYFKLKDFVKAKQIMNLALQRSPNEGVIMGHLAEIHDALGEKNKALNAFRKALSMRLDEGEKKQIKAKYIRLGGEV